MNEHIDVSHGYLVEYNHSEPYHHGAKYFNDEISLEETMDRILHTPEAQHLEMGKSARNKYESIRRSFTNNICSIMERITELP